MSDNTQPKPLNWFKARTRWRERIKVHGWAIDTGFVLGLDLSISSLEFLFFARFGIWIFKLEVMLWPDAELWEPPQMACPHCKGYGGIGSTGFNGEPMNSTCGFCRGTGQVAAS